MLEKTSVNDTVRRRLTIAAEETGTTRQELALLADVSEAAVGLWFKNGKISRDSLVAIAPRLGRSTDWILGLLPESENQIAETRATYQDSATAEMMGLFATLPQDRRDTLLALARQLGEAPRRARTPIHAPDHQGAADEHQDEARPEPVRQKRKLAG